MTYPGFLKPMAAKHQPKPRKAKASKRPPLAWDSELDKPIKFTWGLFVKGKLVPNVVAYNVTQGWYCFKDRPDHKCQKFDPFIVQRLA